MTRELVEVQTTNVELTADAERQPGGIAEDQEQIEQEHWATARQELGTFRAALQDARERREAGYRDVCYDTADPVQDERADVLIQYLVRTDYAEVRTEERPSEHYIYCINVHWDRLRALLAREGQTSAI